MISFTNTCSPSRKKSTRATQCDRPPFVPARINCPILTFASVHRRTTFPWLLPIISVIAFVMSYATAARLYPGGTRADPQRVGFSFTENYWCDLIDVTTYAGRHNGARPVAIGAMIVLCMGLAVLWWSVPVLFPWAPRRGALVRVAGVSSGVVIPLVATPMHDLAIDVAGILGVLGFVTTVTALGSRAGRALNVLAGSALLIAVSNFAIWQSGVGLSVLPLVQKGAFALFLGWVVLLALHLRRETLNTAGQSVRTPPSPRS